MNARGSQKHEREAVRMIERVFPGARARIESRKGKNSHKWLVVQHEHDCVRVCMAGSPGIDVDTLMQHLRRNVARAFAREAQRGDRAQ